MTINEYLNKLPDMVSQDGTKFKDTMMDMVEIWSNDACMGYCVLAMERAGFDRKEIRNVLSCFNRTFDEVSVDKAGQTYIDF